LGGGSAEAVARVGFIAVGCAMVGGAVTTEATDAPHSVQNF
jgi:hypothetical protein